MASDVLLNAVRDDDVDVFLANTWITAHSFLSLSWDEWGSIIAILTAVVLILRWITNRFNVELFQPIYNQLEKVNQNLKEFNQRQSAAEERLERGDKKFIHHEDELEDHERRITHLEEQDHDKIQ